MNHVKREVLKALITTAMVLVTVAIANRIGFTRGLVQQALNG